MARWWWGAAVVLVLVAGTIYVNVWSIFSFLHPLLEEAEQVPVSEPSAFTVPEGFAVHIYASDVAGARVLVRDPKGTMLVSEPGAGRVVALPDTNADHTADGVVPVLTELRAPHGLAFRCPEAPGTSPNSCVLYVAESNAIKAYTYNADTFTARYIKTLLTVPSDGGHTTRSLLLHPDGKTLLVSIGSSCNICNEQNPLRATIQAIDLDTGEVSVYASGLRNTVFMAINPVTGDVWGTDMGRDLLGDDVPPDEVNILKRGGEYGWPICYGNNIHDTAFDQNTYIRAPCTEPFELPSYLDLQAHSAPLGIAFVPEEGWPEYMANDILVAYHGSWNRSVPTGYKVVRFDIAGNYKGEAVDFMTGFIAPDGSILGRPVGLLAEPGGVLYVTDDRAGAIYRITRTSLD